MKKEYRSNLNDFEWELIYTLIPVYKLGRIRKVNIRNILNGILYLNRTGCQWDAIPENFETKSVIWYYYSLFMKNDIWKLFNDKIRKHLRVVEGRFPEASAGILDSQSI